MSGGNPDLFRFLGKQRWCLLHTGDDRHKGHSYCLPPPVICFSLVLLSLLSGDIQSKLKPCYYWEKQLAQIRLNWLNCKSMREYFGNVMTCLYISEPGPNLRQNEWHFCTGSCFFFRTQTLPSLWLLGRRAGWQTVVGFMLLVYRGLLTSPRAPRTRTQEGQSFTEAGGLSDTTIGV